MRLEFVSGAMRALHITLVGWLALTAIHGCGFPKYTFPDSHDAPDACTGSDCGLVCESHFADCNNDVKDGCETQLGTSADCNGCSAECTNDHGATRCVTNASDDTASLCAPTCAVGYADCDLNPNNGCETNINSDSLNCGACDHTCSANGGTPLCQAGKCGVSACNPGFGDCSNAGSCDQNLNSDPQNCGRCGHVCSGAHGTPSCNGGVCQLSCDSGYGDCNALSTTDGGLPPDDGCETKLNVPDNGGVPNCGGCGMGCGRRAFTSVNLEQCALGVCARDCIGGTSDCDNNRNDPSCTGSACGCAGLGSNAQDCGACGHTCKGGACSAGLCECPDTKPKSGSTKCPLASTVSCGDYGSGCHCTCKSGLFQCTDTSGKAC